MKTKPNAAWHVTHPMPAHATLDQRVRWHLSHAMVCGCRPMPGTVVAEIRRRDSGRSTSRVGRSNSARNSAKKSGMK